MSLFSMIPGVFSTPSLPLNSLPFKPFLPLNIPKLLHHLLDLPLTPSPLFRSHFGSSHFLLKTTIAFAWIVKTTHFHGAQRLEHRRGAERVGSALATRQQSSCGTQFVGRQRLRGGASGECTTCRTRASLEAREGPRSCVDTTRLQAAMASLGPDDLEEKKVLDTAQRKAKMQAATPPVKDRIAQA